MFQVALLFMANVTIDDEWNCSLWFYIIQYFFEYNLVRITINWQLNISEMLAPQIDPCGFLLNELQDVHNIFIIYLVGPAYSIYLLSFLIISWWIAYSFFGSFIFEVICDEVRECNTQRDRKLFEIEQECIDVKWIKRTRAELN